MERNYWKLDWKLFSDVLLLKRRFYFTCDITSDVSIEANTVASTQLDIADIDSM